MTEHVLKLLLEKHPDLMDKVDDMGYSFLHQWADIGKDWPLKLLIEKEGDFDPTIKTRVFTHYIYCTTEDRTLINLSPLHIAAVASSIDFTRALIRGYHACQQEMRITLDRPPPWKLKDYKGNTPLHLGVYNAELTKYYLSLDPTLSQTANNSGECPLIMALYEGYVQVAEEILKIQDLPCRMLFRYDGCTVLHLLYRCPGNNLIYKLLN